MKNPYLYMILKKYETTLYKNFAQIESLIRSIRSIILLRKGMLTIDNYAQHSPYISLYGVLKPTL